jgi:trk system potassium uptake protein TrkA
MNVMIVGGGRTGTQLAYLLMEQKHQVHVLDHRNEVLARLHRELPTEVIYEGDATEVDVMERAGIRGVDVLAACTTSDEDNLVVCLPGATAFWVPHHRPHQ